MHSSSPSSNRRHQHVHWLARGQRTLNWLHCLRFQPVSATGIKVLEPLSSIRHLVCAAMNITIQDGPEARAWLQNNGHGAALASNRFPSTAVALEFIERLYAAGAVRIFVPQDTIIADEEELELGGPYSDSIVIELNASGVSPTLDALYRSEASVAGWDLNHEALPVIQGRYLFLWWD
jgi:hypothetical protein